jgi:hypothetical protein
MSCIRPWILTIGFVIGFIIGVIIGFRIGFVLGLIIWQNRQTGCLWAYTCVCCRLVASRLLFVSKHFVHHVVPWFAIRVLCWGIFCLVLWWYGFQTTTICVWRFWFQTTTFLQIVACGPDHHYFVLWFGAQTATICCGGLWPRPPLFVWWFGLPNPHYWCRGFGPSPPLFVWWFGRQTELPNHN